jgi:hypothetical protein
MIVLLLSVCLISSRVPLGGFANLIGASGLTKFSVARLDYSPNRLPMASTWYVCHDYVLIRGNTVSIVMSTTVSVQFQFAQVAGVSNQGDAERETKCSADLW